LIVPDTVKTVLPGITVTEPSGFTSKVAAGTVITLGTVANSPLVSFEIATYRLCF
jgi:hypothetical protein